MADCSRKEAGSQTDPSTVGTFSGYSRHFWSAKIPRDRQNELVWVHRWYTPEDLRSSATTQRHKFLAQAQPGLTTLPAHWLKQNDPPLRAFSRSHEERRIHTSHWSSRCEEWSTLRQMLPSRGHCRRQSPPKWGTGISTPPGRGRTMPKRFPAINSPMTK